MKFFVLAGLVLTGCYATTMELRSGSMTYEASGLNAPTPMESAAADLTSAQADCVRSESGRENPNPERCFGGYGYGGYYGGYGSYGIGRVDSNYYYAPYSYMRQAPDSAFGDPERGAGGSEALHQGRVEEEGR